MIRRYNLRLSDNAPFTGRKAYTCSGNGYIVIDCGFAVQKAVITWSSLPNYDAPYEQSSSSSSTSSSSSIDSSSSSSSQSVSSSSSSTSGSSSSSTSSSSSSSNSSSSSKDSSSSSSTSNSSSSSSSSKDSSSSSSEISSESSGAFDDFYCMAGAIVVPLANGTYYRTGTYFRDRPVYFNGTYYLYWHYFATWFEWCIAGTVGDNVPGLYKLAPTLTPDGADWSEGIMSNGACPSSSTSSSSSSSSSQTSNEYPGPFNRPRIYISDYISNGFRVRYENIPEEVGYVEFAYFAV